LTVVESQNFYRQFFKALDGYRQNLGQFLRNDSAIVWNGNPIGGVDAFLQMYSTMPITQHEVLSFNCHPLPNGNAEMINMMLDTSGKVKFGTDRAKNVFGFSAVFIIRKDPGASQIYVSSFSYRLVHKPADSTVEQ
jgi:NTF2-related export protein 1/2